MDVVKAMNNHTSHHEHHVPIAFATASLVLLTERVYWL